MIEWLVQEVFAKYNYWTSIGIMLIGLWGTLAKGNLLKKLIALSIFQTGIFLFYVSFSDVGSLSNWGLRTATPPIVWEPAVERGYVYSNPLPHVLMLTGIVVSAATTGVALALVVRMYQKYGTIEEEEIMEKEMEMEGER